MPIVYCPACRQEALVLATSPAQRRCSRCRQEFWTDNHREPSKRRPPAGQKAVQAQPTR